LERRACLVDGPVFHRITQKALVIFLEERVCVLERGQPVQNTVLIHRSRPHTRCLAMAISAMYPP
jgi:hypothetical protein